MFDKGLSFCSRWSYILAEGTCEHLFNTCFMFNAWRKTKISWSFVDITQHNFPNHKFPHQQFPQLPTT